MFTQNIIKVIKTRQKKVSAARRKNTSKIDTALTTLSDLSFQFKTDRAVELLKDLKTQEMIMKIFELFKDPVKYQMLNKRFYNGIYPNLFRQIV